MSDAYQIKTNRELTRDMARRTVKAYQEFETFVRSLKARPAGDLPFSDTNKMFDLAERHTVLIEQALALPVNTPDYTPWYTQLEAATKTWEDALAAWKKAAAPVSSPATASPTAVTTAKKSDDDDTGTMLLIAGVAAVAVIAFAVYYTRKQS